MTIKLDINEDDLVTLLKLVKQVFKGEDSKSKVLIVDNNNLREDLSTTTASPFSSR